MITDVPSVSSRISKISLTVFVVLFVLSGLLLSVDGNYWPWYAVMAFFTVPPILIGRGRYRLLGILSLALSVVLIISDIEAGKQFRAKHPEIYRNQ